MINAPWAGAPRGPHTHQQRQSPNATPPERPRPGSGPGADLSLFFWMDVVLSVVIILLAIAGGVLVIWQLIAGSFLLALAVMGATALAMTSVGLGRVLISIARSAHSIDLQMRATRDRLA